MTTDTRSSDQPGTDDQRDVRELREVLSRLAGADRLDGPEVGDGVSDAELITRIDALERAKSACAAAQARLTARFVQAQAEEADRWRRIAAQRSADGDFDGWVVAKDHAASLELPPDPGRGDPDQETKGSAGAGSAADGSTGAGSEARSSSTSRRRRVRYARTGVSGQVALARHESPSRGARLGRLAVTLVEQLPHTLAALTAGLLSERRAELVASGTSHLPPELRAIVDAEVIGANTPGPHEPLGAGISGWGDRETTRRVKACADRLDPAAAVERARRAEQERHVSTRPVPDCMALVSALLPVHMAVAVYAALVAAATTAKAAGDSRSRGQVMADTLFERVTGTATAGDLDLEVQVVITDRALFTGDDTPAHIPGYGPVPAGWVRDLLTKDLQPPETAPPGAARDEQPSDAPPDTPASPETQASLETQASPDTQASPGRAGSPSSCRPGERAAQAAQAQAATAAKIWLRRLYTHPGTGTLVGMDSSARLFPAGLRRFLIARDGVCRTPWCDAPVAHADHVTAHTDGGATNDTNGQGLCITCNLTKDLAGWYSRVIDPGPTAGSDNPHTVRITTPTGHTYLSTAPPVLTGHHEPGSNGTGNTTGRTPLDIIHTSALEQHLGFYLDAA